MIRYMRLTLRATSIVILGAWAASALLAKSDDATNTDYLYQYLGSNGVQIRYVEMGAGEPLVLIPALSGTIEDWIKAGGFTLPYHTLVLDRQDSDSGRSASAAGEDVIRLLDLLRIPRAHVVGYSSGAEVVAYLSRIHPDRLLTAAACELPQATLPGPGVVELPAESNGRIPDPQFMRSLALFLHSHPASRRLWAPLPPQPVAQQADAAR